MKLCAAVLTGIAALLSADASTMLKKARVATRAPKSLAAGEEPHSSRKLSLFVRTRAVSTEETSDKSPIFGAATGPVPLLASTLAGTGLSQPTGTVTGTGTVVGGGDCHPKCTWNCGAADCDEVCDPVCAPPQCETACGAINLAACRQRCEPPKCAIVCPTAHCEHGGCPACKTICAPPKCTTECAEQCESKCSEPQCTWKCNPGQCEKPRCTLTCGGAKVCGLDGNLNARPPPFSSGMTVLSKGLAATDPKSLAAFASGGGPKGAAPAAGPGKAPSAAPKGPIR